MKRALRINRGLLAFGVTASLLTVLIALMKSAPLSENKALSLGISLDLLLIVPLVYFLLIRKTSIPNTTTVPIMVLGLVIGTYFLPKEDQTYLDIFKNWALPLIEITVFTYIVYKVRKVVKAYKNVESANVDFFTTVKEACAEVLPPKIVLPFATEVAVIYYGFFSWRKKTLQENEFSYHKKSGSVGLLIALIVIIGVETLVLHILLERWNPIVAWVLTVLSAYTGLQLFGFMKSLLRRPIVIEGDQLNLRYGIMTEAQVEIDNIEHIQLSTKDIELDEETRKLSFLGQMDGHNMVLTFKEPIELSSLYGIKRTARILALHVDEPLIFKKNLEEN